MILLTIKNVATDKNSLSETDLLSTHNTYLERR